MTDVYLQIAERKGPSSVSFFIKNLGFLLKNAPTAFKKAEECFYRAIAAGDKAGDKNLVGRTYINLGLLYKAKKRTSKAREYFIEAIKVLEEIEAEVFLKQAQEALENIEGA